MRGAGAAWRHAAKQHNLAESIAELREIANGRDDILAEAAGLTAGSWYPLAVHPCRHFELLVAGMLIMALGRKQASRRAAGSRASGYFFR
jgi:hypothetical protein